MTGLDALWLPLLLSSVIVFIASSIIHMLSPWHKSAYPMLANQDAVMREGLGGISEFAIDHRFLRSEPLPLPGEDRHAIQIRGGVKR
jgi:hypothetical protein